MTKEQIKKMEKRIEVLEEQMRLLLQSHGDLLEWAGLVEKELNWAGK